MRRTVVLAALLGVLAWGQVARAATITFDGTTSDGVPFSAAYSEAGYTLTPNAGQMFFVDAAMNSVTFPGLATFSGDLLEFNNSLSQFTLTQVGGGAFDLVSVMTGSLGRDALDDGDFIFTGMFLGGGSIAATVPGVAAPSTTSFTGFTSLTSVIVTTNDGQFPVMDNLVGGTSPQRPRPASRHHCRAGPVLGDPSNRLASVLLHWCMQKYHDEPKQYKGYLKSDLAPVPARLDPSKASSVTPLDPGAHLSCGTRIGHRWRITQRPPGWIRPLHRTEPVPARLDPISQTALAFGRRGIPSSGVARQSHTPGMFPPRG